MVLSSLAYRLGLSAYYRDISRPVNTASKLVAPGTVVVTGPLGESGPSVMQKGPCVWGPHA